MRLARTLLLAVAAAVATMAFMAGSASAQSVEVLNEANMQHCPAITESASGHNTSAGCEIQAVSQVNMLLVTHVVGIGEVQTASCQSTLTANIDEDGQGFIDVDASTLVENEATGCAIEPCDEGEGAGVTTPHADLEWPIFGIGEISGGVEVMAVTFCARPHNTGEGVGPVPCTVVLDILHPEAHEQEIGTFEDPCRENPTRELTGQWLTNDAGGTVDIEIRHVHYPGDNP